MRNILQIKVGLRIKDLRAVHDVSQERFANKIGMDRTYLASIEVGQRNVTLQNLAKIANGFDMTLSEFFEGIPRVDPIPDHFDQRFVRRGLYYTYMLYKHNKKVTNDDKSATSGIAIPTPSRSATESRGSVAGRDDPLRQSAAKAHASCLKSG